MLSFAGFKLLITIIFVWFVLGSVVISIFAARELVTLITKKEKKVSKESDNMINSLYQKNAN